MKGMFYISYLVVMLVLVLVLAAEIINFASKTVYGKKVITRFEL